jgi:carboxymethylenebutenolidase
MSGEMVDVQTKDGVADAYLAKPDTDGDYPGVLLVVDAFGLRDQIKLMADRIASRGFVVLAPNLFYRTGRAPAFDLPDMTTPEGREQMMTTVMPLIVALTNELMISDADAYLGLLEEVAHGPVAITGYCMGGRIGWAITAAYPERVAALGAFHTGRLVTADESSPHLSASSINAELYLGFADNDASATPEDIATLEGALQAAGVRYRSEIYEGASHGYTMNDTNVYDETAAERHYMELFALLERTVAA